MSKPLTAAERIAFEVDFATMFPTVKKQANKHQAPFSKTANGKARRTDRRNAIAAKRSFLNS